MAYLQMSLEIYLFIYLASPIITQTTTCTQPFLFNPKVQTSKNSCHHLWLKFGAQIWKHEIHLKTLHILYVHHAQKKVDKPYVSRLNKANINKNNNRKAGTPQQLEANYCGPFCVWKKHK